jgi:uncharacterized membrane protein YqgA involved in biofilm formation
MSKQLPSDVLFLAIQEAVKKDQLPSDVLFFAIQEAVKKDQSVFIAGMLDIFTKVYTESALGYGEFTAIDVYSIKVIDFLFSYFVGWSSNVPPPFLHENSDNLAA